MWSKLENGLPEALGRVGKEGEDFLRIHEDAIVSTVLDYVKNYKPMLSKGAGLIIGGGSGSGKTVLGAWIFCQLMKNGLSGIYVTEPTLRNNILNNVMYDDDMGFREYCLEVSVLFLDGVSPSKGETWPGNIVWEFLEERESYRNLNLIAIKGDPVGVVRNNPIAGVLKGLGIPLDLGSKDLREKRQREMYGWVRNGA